MTRTLKLTAGLSLCLVLALAAVATVWTARAQQSIQDWPELTIRYEISGQYYSLGDQKPEVTKEILLTYRSLNDWRREVVSSTSVTSGGGGTIDETGSYMEVKNGTVTEYNTLIGDVLTNDVSPDTYMVPEPRLAPIPFENAVEQYGGEPEKIETDVRLCWNTTCEEKAQGWAFAVGDEVYVYAEDKRGIPLVMPSLDITEVNVVGEREPVDW